MSLAIGLLAWLAWEAEIDVRAAIERTSPIDLDKEDAPWYPLQVFAVVAALLAADQDAQRILSGAVMRTARKGADVAAWLATHFDLADRLSRAMKAPDSFGTLDRPPRPGDLIILGPKLAPPFVLHLKWSPLGPQTR